MVLHVDAAIECVNRPRLNDRQKCEIQHVALPYGIIAIATQVSNAKVIHHYKDNIRLVISGPLCLADA